MKNVTAVAAPERNISAVKTYMYAGNLFVTCHSKRFLSLVINKQKRKTSIRKAVKHKSFTHGFAKFILSPR
jgi:membrane-bound metal-dependent hydrolase YbcI (DUF457 family)